ncbi:hypothetical protein CPB84DRAFT_1540962 [Gymnopilus junonius]|uniref:Zn(2)-C6 fungal-type domain-containing protein n=1 Tax=Gymnopilus junonius TaxID=109634 RepID=A0A9P5TKP9_GYMJU|nr:hypothetical protein CPB84DRAFT_1540962 [Gymnopilus junonius]
METQCYKPRGRITIAKTGINKLIESSSLPSSGLPKPETKSGSWMVSQRQEEEPRFASEITGISMPTIEEKHAGTATLFEQAQPAPKAVLSEPQSDYQLGRRVHFAYDEDSMSHEGGAADDGKKKSSLNSTTKLFVPADDASGTSSQVRKDTSSTDQRLVKLMGQLSPGTVRRSPSNLPTPHSLPKLPDLNASARKFFPPRSIDGLPAEDRQLAMQKLTGSISETPVEEAAGQVEDSHPTAGPVHLPNMPLSPCRRCKILKMKCEYPNGAMGKCRRCASGGHECVILMRRIPPVTSIYPPYEASPFGLADMLREGLHDAPATQLQNTQHRGAAVSSSSAVFPPPHSKETPAAVDTSGSSEAEDALLDALRHLLRKSRSSEPPSPEAEDLEETNAPVPAPDADQRTPSSVKLDDDLKFHAMTIFSPGIRTPNFSAVPPSSTPSSSESEYIPIAPPSPSHTYIPPRRMRTFTTAAVPESESPSSFRSDSPQHLESGSKFDHSAPAYILAFFLDTVPRQIYLYMLLRLPHLYFSRVTRIFEEAEMSMPMIKQGILDAARAKGEPGYGAGMVGEKMVTMSHPHLPMEYWEPQAENVAYTNLQNTWHTFVDSLQKEWKTLNIISVLLLT